jgi:hypothetical protein
MDTSNVCARCAGPGANTYSGDEWTHYYMGDCIEHLRRRAEAAELSASRNRGALWDEHQRLQAAEAKVAELEDKLARQTFVTDRRPPEGEPVEVLLVAQWEPRIVPEARGRWRDRRYETLSGVLGWRPKQE